MGQGGFITLVNGTKYDWRKTNQHSYQMEAWNFPDTIPAGKSASVYVEWSQAVFKNEKDDSGEADYALAGTSRAFQIAASARTGFNLQVKFTNLATPGNAQGSTRQLGWKHDGYVNFILSGQEGNFTSSNLPTSWMQDNVGLLGDRTLRRLCMPGSHDAGMSIFTSGTAFAYRCNTLTQRVNILEQLRFGARYFDIRPVISGGKYYAGHYSYIDRLNSWQGSNGQSIESIINDVNSYTANNKELVILSLSHDINTDVGNAAYRSFNQDEWNAVFALLKGLNNLFIAPRPTNDLTTLKLKDFIGGNRAAVVVVAPFPDSARLGSYANQGYYTSSQFPVYDHYSDTNDLDKMAADQLRKMKEQRTSPDAGCFLLSWTLTQDTTQATTCNFGTAYSILQLSGMANPQLYSRLLPECSAQCYPNILYIDGIETSDIAAMAMAINSSR